MSLTNHKSRLHLHVQRLINRNMRYTQTHVEGDSDDVQGHCGICHTAEGGGLRRNMALLKIEQTPKTMQCNRSYTTVSTYPFQARGTLFPPSTVSFQKPGGCALLCCTAEPGSSTKDEGSVTLKLLLYHPKDTKLTVTLMQDFDDINKIFHLLMVSSSSESQKLVVSNSLLITVLELSYPARWRSRRLCPFIRGPGTPKKETHPKTKTENIRHVFSCQRLQVYLIDHKHAQHSLIISHCVQRLEDGGIPDLDRTI